MILMDNLDFTVSFERFFGGDFFKWSFGDLVIGDWSFLQDQLLGDW